MAAVISATDSEVTKPINAVFQQQFLRQASPYLHYMMGTKPTALQKFGGAATAKWRRVGAITPSTTALSEQTGNAAFFGGRDAVGVSNTDVTATLAKYGQAVVLTEEAENFNPKQQVSEIIKAIAIAGGRSLNMLQRDIVDDNATVIYAGAAASTGALVSKITLASIELAVMTLVTNSARPFMPMTKGDSREGTAPILQSFWLVCHPYVAYDIMKMAGFKGVQTYAGQVSVAPNEFGVIEGVGYAVRCVQCVDGTADANAGGSVTGTGLRSTGASVIDVYTTAIYGEDALGSVGLGSAHDDGIYSVEGMDSLPDSIKIIEKGFGSGGTSDPFDEIRTIAYKFWHAGAVLNSGWARVIKSGATNVTGA